jgi:RimJ/RimL family protein N-acetyltransferase
MDNQLVKDVRLRDVAASDLPSFYEYQLDPTANHMAAFTAKDPADRQAFEAHFARILSDEAVTVRTILWQERVVGHIASFERSGDLEVAYWIGKEHWGQGIATEALSQFLHHIKPRPLYARAAADNIASLRVLEKCGFRVTGHDKGFANARAQEIEEAILKLE